MVRGKRVLADVAPAAENDVKPRSRVCRSERRALAASEQRRCDADTARLERVARCPRRVPCPRVSTPFVQDRLPNRPRGQHPRRGPSPLRGPLARAGVPERGGRCSACHGRNGRRAPILHE